MDNLTLENYFENRIWSNAGELERSVASNPPHLNSTSTMLQQGTKPAFTVPSHAALNPTSPHTPTEKGSRVGVAHAEVEESSDVEI